MSAKLRSDRQRIRELIAECDRVGNENSSLEDRIQVLTEYKDVLEKRNRELLEHNRALTKVLKVELEMRSPEEEP